MCGEVQLVLKEQYTETVEGPQVSKYPEDINPEISRRCLEEFLSGAQKNLGVKPSTESKKSEPVEPVARAAGIVITDVTTTYTIVAAATTAFVAFLKYVSPLLREWLRNRGSRSLRIKSGDKEIEFKGSLSDKDIEKGLATLQALLGSNSAKKETCSDAVSRGVGR